MAYQQSPPYAHLQPVQPDVVSGEQYRYALTNFVSSVILSMPLKLSLTSFRSSE